MLGEVFYKRSELNPLVDRSHQHRLTVQVGGRMAIVHTTPNHPMVWTQEGSAADRLLRTLNISRMVA